MDAYKTLREEAYEANLEIPRRGLAIYTWGNVSAFDRNAGVFAIKPSGVAYDALRPGDMVVVDLEGNVVDSRLRPSSDTPTHRVLYERFNNSNAHNNNCVNGVTHTHSTYATAWAQAGRAIPLLGTTHADHAPAAVPCTAFLSTEAMSRDYELETGLLIVETLNAMGIDSYETPMALVAGHGPFTWGKSAAKSVYHAAVLEEVAKMAYLTLTLAPAVPPLPAWITNKHYERKHGKNAYYGQK
ncbi:MAG: L-ribulose-5-phosphate 4-epimerase AraD [Treponematales bacterium]